MVAAAVVAAAADLEEVPAAVVRAVVVPADAAQVALEAPKTPAKPEL